MLKPEIGLFSCLFLLAGCALTRGEVDLRVDEVANPSTSMTVKITEVTDREIKGSAKVTGAIASTTEWKQLFDQGVANLIENVKRVIRTTTDRISRVFDGKPAT